MLWTRVITHSGVALSWISRSPRKHQQNIAGPTPLPFWLNSFWVMCWLEPRWPERLLLGPPLGQCLGAGAGRCGPGSDRIWAAPTEPRSSCREAPQWPCAPMASSESGSESIREEVEAQVRAATAELRRQLSALQVQVAELQRQAGAGAGQPPGWGAGRAGQASQKEGSELACNLVQGPDEETEEEVVEEGEEAAREMEDVPETLFSYCMAQLVINPESIAEPVAYLALQFSIQLGLAMPFITAAAGKFFDLYWKGQAMTPELCLYHENVINDHPYQDVVAAMCCFCLAAVAMMADDKERLSSIYPDRSHSLRVRAVVTACWSLQGFIVPTIILTSIPILMVNSMNAVDVVLNGLAVLFILDVDDMLYVIVPSSHRDRLKQQFLTQSTAYRWVRIHSARLEAEAIVMATYKFLFMVFFYLQIVVYTLPSTGPALAASWFTEDDFAHCVIEHILCYWMLPFISTFAWHQPTDVYDIIATIRRAVCTAVFGVYLPCMLLLYGHSRWIGPPSLTNSRSIIECYNKTYKATGPPGGIVLQTP
ncbi:unnamed protein product [Prorocentrum cordatum]|uniref:Uncharacterized protein n=1 Tax=Prorocentrum cordatum TaxID=2364126 RepID=A0ABN9SJQ4_9DINO|nr:unnamed protein product [Polarella glacialis]